MDGVLDVPRAELLVKQVVQTCCDKHSGALVDVVVIWPGGKTIAHATTAKEGQASRPLLVRDINVQAVAARTDYPSIPRDWAQKQTYGIGASPRLIGAVLRICYDTGTRDRPDVQVVGVIGLLGIEADSAQEILSRVIRGNGFLIFSDLPQIGAQG